MTYSVKLEVFEGPLDLLLHLVSKERVDVSEISISSITEDYLKVLRRMEEMDLETASSFLVLAATLLELKSLRLLPGRGYEDPEIASLLEERDHLLHKLIEYSTFKGISEWMTQEFEKNQGYHSRAPSIPDELYGAAPDILEGVTVDDLLQAARRALLPKPAPKVETNYIAPIRVSVRDTIDQLVDNMRSVGTSTFSELCREAAARIEVIVRFLALLEMFRTNSIELEQTTPFGEIVVRWKEPKLGTNR